MKSRWLRWRGATVILAAALVLAGTDAVDTCAPSSERAVFTHVPHPDFPLAAFAAGNLGVIQPTYARSYLVVAYRHLSGRPLDSAEQAGVRALWERRIGWLAPDFWDGRTDLRQDSDEALATVARKNWLDRRRLVPGLPLLDRIDTYQRVKPGGWADFDNCLTDAFVNASLTFDRVTASFGLPSPAAVEWVRAQDAVFARCSGDAALPATLGANASASSAADREYQTAAALFYGRDFDAAEARFRQIARDQTSPWRTIAPYLAARALIRKATLMREDGVDLPTLARAEQQLQTVLADPAQAPFHRSARALLGFVQFRLNPTPRLHELGVVVAGGGSPDALATNLGDYTQLMDRVIGERPSATARSEASLPAAAVADPMTDWIATFQWPGREALDHAVTRWEATGAPLWLMTAVSKTSASDPRAPTLRDAAWRAPAGTPEFPTLAYHAARLAIEGGDGQLARARLDALLSAHQRSWPRSTVNLFLALRMRVALTLEEWLTFAARKPATSTIDIDGTEIPETDARYSRLLRLGDPRLFDSDSTQAFNRGLPLARLIDAARSEALPSPLRRDIAIAAWTRAVLVGDDAAARSLVPLVRALAPELTSDMAAYMSSADDTTRQLSAVTTLLRFPGTRPLVDPGLGRDQVLGKIESYRDNWWCEMDPASSAANPAFLSESDRRTAAGEYARLAALDTAPNYLAAEAVRLARLKPNDPRAPEILHLAVRATRYGCTDKDTGSRSQAAFELLHRKYPNSEWAKKTPFWFKGD